VGHIAEWLNEFQFMALLRPLLMTRRGNPKGKALSFWQNILKFMVRYLRAKASKDATENEPLLIHVGWIDSGRQTHSKSASLPNFTFNENLTAHNFTKLFGNR